MTHSDSRTDFPLEGLTFEINEALFPLQKEMGTAYENQDQDFYVIDRGEFLKGRPWCETGTYVDIFDQ